MTTETPKSQRSYSVEYRERILAEYDALPPRGGHRMALLRRESLYPARLAEWRKRSEGSDATDGRPPAQTARWSRTAARLESVEERFPTTFEAWRDALIADLDLVGTVLREVIRSSKSHGRTGRPSLTLDDEGAFWRLLA